MSLCEALVFVGTGAAVGVSSLIAAIACAYRSHGLDVRVASVGPDGPQPLLRQAAGSRGCVVLNEWLLAGELLHACQKHSYDGDIMLIDGGTFVGAASTTVLNSMNDPPQQGMTSAVQLSSLLSARLVVVSSYEGSNNACSKDQLCKAVATACQRDGDATNSIPLLLPAVVVCRADATGCASDVRQLLRERMLHIPVLGYVPESELFSATVCRGMSHHLQSLAEFVSKHVDLAALRQLGSRVQQPKELPTLLMQQPQTSQQDDLSAPAAMRVPPVSAPIRIAYAMDDAFYSYYQENLGLLQHKGAELVPFSPLNDGTLPPGTSAVYLGGGQPEHHCLQLLSNLSMRAALWAFVGAGGFVYSDSGAGLVYLSRSIQHADGHVDEMVGLLPFRAQATPVKRGLVAVKVLSGCPLYSAGTTARGFFETHCVLVEECIVAGLASATHAPASSGMDACASLYCATAVGCQGTVLEGFVCGPHRNIVASCVQLFYPSNPELVTWFLERCRLVDTASVGVAVAGAAAIATSCADYKGAAQIYGAYGPLTGALGGATNTAGSHVLHTQAPDPAPSQLSKLAQATRFDDSRSGIPVSWAGDTRASGPGQPLLDTVVKQDAGGRPGSHPSRWPWQREGAWLPGSQAMQAGPAWWACALLPRRGLSCSGAGSGRGVSSLPKPGAVLGSVDNLGLLAASSAESAPRGGVAAWPPVLGRSHARLYGLSCPLSASVLPPLKGTATSAALVHGLGRDLPHGSSPGSLRGAASSVALHDYAQWPLGPGPSPPSLQHLHATASLHHHHRLHRVPLTRLNGPPASLLTSPPITSRGCDAGLVQRVPSTSPSPDGSFSRGSSAALTRPGSSAWQSRHSQHSSMTSASSSASVSNLAALPAAKHLFNNSIVCLSPGATELLVAMGLTARLVGVSDSCDYPKDALAAVPAVSISRCGVAADAPQRCAALWSRGKCSFHLDEDALRAARPALVVLPGLAQLHPTDANALQRVLERAGLTCGDGQTTLLQHHCHSLADTLDFALLLGAATCTPHLAQLLVEQLRRRLRQLAGRAALLAAGEGGSGGSRWSAPRVLVLASLAPLTLAGGWVPEMLQLAGVAIGAAPCATCSAGCSLYSAEPGAPPRTVTWAELRAAAPEVLVVANSRGSALRQLAEVADLPGWWQLPAVRAGEVRGRRAGVVGHNILHGFNKWGAEPRAAGLYIARQPGEISWAEVYSQHEAFLLRPGPRLVDGCEALARCCWARHSPVLATQLAGHRSASTSPLPASSALLKLSLQQGQRCRQRLLANFFVPIPWL